MSLAMRSPPSSPFAMQEANRHLPLLISDPISPRLFTACLIFFPCRRNSNVDLRFGSREAPSLQTNGKYLCKRESQRMSVTSLIQLQVHDRSAGPLTCVYLGLAVNYPMQDSDGATFGGHHGQLYHSS